MIDSGQNSITELLTDSSIAFGLGIRQERKGVHQIIPNVFSSDKMYSLIFNHDPVTVLINDKRELLPAKTFCIWDQEARVYYGEANEKWTISWLQLYPEVINSYLQQYGISINTPVIFNDDRIVSRHFTSIYEELREYKEVDDEIINNSIQRVILEFHRTYERRDSLRQVVPVSFKKLQIYIEKNYRKQLTLEELASQIHLAPSYLSRKYKEYFGCGPIEYAINLRLSEATYYLKSTTLNIQEIASEVGYESFYHFSKMFKRHYKVSPREFRHSSKM